MPDCPHCLEEIKAGARKCPHCQTPLEQPSGAENATVYILDKGLIRFGKFVVGVLAIFVLVGVYLFGYDIKEASKKTAEAEIQVEKALIEIKRQRAALDSEISASQKIISDIEREMASHSNAAQLILKEARELVFQIRGQREEAGKYVIELRTLGASDARLAVTKREEKGIDASRGKLWKNGSTLRFSFLDGGEPEKITVRLAIGQWAEHVNLIFKETSSEEAEIRISFTGAGFWSYIGTDALVIPKNRPTLNIQKLGEQSDRDVAMQSALSAFGHALGLLNEYQNPRAGDIFDRTALLAVFSKEPYKWDKVTTEKNMLVKVVTYPGSRTYDPQSIMNKSLPREVYLPGMEGRPGSGLSESDKSYVASLYPRS
jgi:hypothetical protein